MSLQMNSACHRTHMSEEADAASEINAVSKTGATDDTSETDAQ